MSIFFFFFCSRRIFFTHRRLLPRREEFHKILPILVNRRANRGDEISFFLHYEEFTTGQRRFYIYIYLNSNKAIYNKNCIYTYIYAECRI